MKKKILLVVSTRPNFMKVAPILVQLREHGDRFDTCLVHTGQHYDANLSDVHFADLNLPPPDHHLEAGSGTHGVQTGRTMAAFDPVLIEEKPDLVVVVGDVTGTMACALDAVKMHIPVAHVEAGLRSGDRKMPEEINRIVTDAVSDLLFTPSRDGDDNLRAEGIPKERIRFVGNIMVDSLQHALSSLHTSTILEDHGLEPQGYAFLTMHRDFNVDFEDRLRQAIGAVDRVQRRIPVVFPIHPRTRARIETFELRERLAELTNLQCIEPVGYLDSLMLQKESRLVLSDSAGLQEESTVFGVPCLTMRPSTERPVTVDVGTATIVDLDADLIEAKTDEVLDGTYKNGVIPELWDGATAQRIVDVFVDRL
jgi:UDP-N-acetylglucosamine 2-epimerase (non-hydrolysing)